MDGNCWDKIQKSAYLKYLNRKNSNMPEDSYQDWVEAMEEEGLSCDIAKEAYYNYLRGGNDPINNWEIAKADIMDRIRFIAFYMHESNLNKSPLENWINAKNLYLNKF
jgi:hypothetical protein